MTLLLLSVALSAATGVWVILPLVRHSQPVLADSGAGGGEHQRERQRVALASLRDAELDHAMGKLDDADFSVLRRQLAAEAVAALHAGDAPGDTPLSGARHRCGFQNPAGSRFCAGCGAALG